MFKKAWTTSSNINNYSTLNSEHNWEGLCIYSRNQQHALLITITNQGRSNFQFDFCICFIIDMLLQCDFCCVNLIGRSWRTWKEELHDTHMLYHVLSLRTTLLSPTLTGSLMIAQPTKKDDWFNSNAWSHITLLSWWVVFSCPPFIFNLKH